MCRSLARTSGGAVPVPQHDAPQMSFALAPPRAIDYQFVNTLATRVQGHLTSYYGPTFEKYTACQVSWVPLARAARALARPYLCCPTGATLGFVGPRPPPSPSADARAHGSMAVPALCVAGRATKFVTLARDQLRCRRTPQRCRRFLSWKIELSRPPVRMSASARARGWCSTTTRTWAGGSLPCRCLPVACCDCCLLPGC